MKKVILVICLLCIMGIIASCGSKMTQGVSNGLMEGASPSTSALAIYYYNGENVFCSYIFESNIEQDILYELDAVRAVEVDDWSLEDITLPIYGLRIGATDGLDIFAAWCNGYWISQTGNVYRFDFDFAKLEKKYSWSHEQELSSFSVFPCAYFLTQDERGWNSTLLVPTEELKAPDGITMTLEAWDIDTVKVSIKNDSSTDWMYGELYSLHVSLNSVWYDIPPTPGGWAFISIGLTIGGGQTQNKTYHLDMYGELPAGTYRLVAFGLSVEKIIP